MTRPRLLRDRRWLFLLAYCTAAWVFVFLVLHHQQDKDNDRNVKFERQIAANCQQTNDSNRKFNAVLDQLALNARRSTALKPEQKRQAIDAYGRLHLPISQCPPTR